MQEGQGVPRGQTHVLGQIWPRLARFRILAEEGHSESRQGQCQEETRRAGWLFSAKPCGEASGQAFRSWNLQREWVHALWNLEGAWKLRPRYLERGGCTAIDSAKGLNAQAMGSGKGWIQRPWGSRKGWVHSPWGLVYRPWGLERGECTGCGL